MSSSINDTIARLSAQDQNIRRPATEGIYANEIEESIKLFRSAVFAGYFDSIPLSASLSRLADNLAGQIARALKLVGKDGSMDSRRIALRLIETIPELRRRLGTDVKAVFDGDPAALSHEEVIMCYPAMTALTHYRFAHELLRSGVPVLPRMITETAHSLTGIDIHPAATIGDYFSIDHGTGVVIGETCIIGDHVRIYQGVTLGAKRLRMDDEGNMVREPRHPIIEDNVVIYSNSSILGRIRIGHDSVIGGNVWQTTDLPPHSCVVQGRPIVSTFEDGGGI